MDMIDENTFGETSKHIITILSGDVSIIIPMAVSLAAQGTSRLHLNTGLI